MCGIAGFFGSYSATLLQRMQTSLSHRGPDDFGIFHDPARGVGLAHRRLAILDTSPAGHQPMIHAPTGVQIIFNGEIYNYRELRKDLETRGEVFRSTSDTEVLLRLFVMEGVHCLKRLNGIFALAVWDPRTADLWLARDPLGVKPLYLHQGNRGILFASEFKAILQEPSVDRALDPQAAHDHIVYLYCPGPRTILKAITKVPPGNWMRFREGRLITQAEYYTLPMQQPLLDVDMQTAASMVMDALATAVRRQMVADVPVGAFLSGGLDSSAVVALARQHTPHRLQCFTIDATEGASTEGSHPDLPYATQVAKHLDVDLHVLKAKPDMMEHLDRALWHLDEPTADPAAINVLLIAEEARRHGIKVLLGGTGGDDLFTGYRRHQAFAAEKHWSWLPQPVRRMMRQTTALLPQRFRFTRQLRKAFAYADQPADLRLAGYFRWLEEGPAADLFSADIAAIPHSQRSRSIVSLLDGLPTTGAGKEALQRMLYLEVKAFLVDHNLHYTDKMTMAAGVEGRVPYLDLDLVSLAFRIPQRLKLRLGCPKAVLKQAALGLLPRDITHRPKTGFGAPIRSWLTGSMSSWVKEMLTPDSLSSLGLFQENGVSNLLKQSRLRSRDVDYPLFAITCLVRWQQLLVKMQPGMSRDQIPGAKETRINP